MNSPTSGGEFGGFDPGRNFAPSRLKWLKSLYRPALPEKSAAGWSGRFSIQPVGASPSGKAVDFDSTIRRFESSRPSQAVTQLEIVSLESDKCPPIAAFCELASVSILPIRTTWERNRR
jgi:hypothetical protein